MRVDRSMRLPSLSASCRLPVEDYLDHPLPTPAECITPTPMSETPRDTAPPGEIGVVRYFLFTSRITATSPWPPHPAPRRFTPADLPPTPWRRLLVDLNLPAPSKPPPSGGASPPAPSPASSPTSTPTPSPAPAPPASTRSSPEAASSNSSPTCSPDRPPATTAWDLACAATFDRSRACCRSTPSARSRSATRARRPPRRHASFRLAGRSQPGVCRGRPASRLLGVFASDALPGQTDDGEHRGRQKRTVCPCLIPLVCPNVLWRVSVMFPQERFACETAERLPRPPAERRLPSRSTQNTPGADERPPGASTHAQCAVLQTAAPATLPAPSAKAPTPSFSRGLKNHGSHRNPEQPPTRANPIASCRLPLLFPPVTP